MERYGTNQEIAPPMYLSHDGYWTPYHVAEERIRELKRENAELRHDIARHVQIAADLATDAERYRWLRDVGDSTWQPMSKRGITAAQCDAAIDAALTRK